eukprot:5918626-Pyramimonas_sp.AAC.1
MQLPICWLARQFLQCRVPCLFGSHEYARSLFSQRCRAACAGALQEAECSYCRTLLFEARVDMRTFARRRPEPASGGHVPSR